MDTSIRFIPPAGMPGRNALAALPLERYTLDEERSTATCTTVYDTFDWRLFQKGYTLLASQTGLDLLPLVPGKAAHHTDSHLMPRWATDLAGPELRTIVEPLIGVRALLPAAQGRVASTTWRVLNADGKMVARLDLQVAQPCHPTARATPSGQLVLHGIKGYGKDRGWLAATLTAAGWQETRQDAIYLNLLALASRTPGDYSAALDLQLEPTMRSDEATKAILRRLLAIMQANESLIMQDIDVEFLHDYRVAIRRTRSVLGQLNQVFAPATVKRFQQDFAAMGRASNRLRDLDVYLLRQEEYTAMVPPELRQAIGPLFEYLRAQRASALAEVAAEIASPPHATIMHDWQQFLSEPGGEHPETRDAARPVIDLAQQRIIKRYRRIVKAGNQLLHGDTGVDEVELHALRIEFKKLRYLLEFFESLFPGKTLKRLVSQLKDVQNILGEINDLRMQETYLENIVMELPVANAGDRATILAVGCLVGKLDDRTEAAKENFAPAFARFAAAETRAQFRELATFAARAQGDDVP